MIPEGTFPFDDYFKILAIQDHCHEVVLLYDEFRKVKAGIIDRPQEHVKAKFEGEMADMLILLTEYFRNKEEVVSSRVRRFSEKAAGK